jgi:repressor of nif and glnA expression
MKKVYFENEKEVFEFISKVYCTSTIDPVQILASREATIQEIIKQGYVKKKYS